ncbi:hypothetical protein CWE08_04900 [Aliidiomarina iranensis]|uniref:Negative regulator of sigma E activity n=1 Tax=Aliidiomarina iranensis TaxID=1434071 RepID=A0A432W0K5_9GAMM|nr:MucB/RseB C-terminal domain-containing protein [Aliidiomarina iranensis]RUO22518.1 hypothetical protein CWE08_04900 [Aliidiomarina iranensis]
MQGYRYLLAALGLASSLICSTVFAAAPQLAAPQQTMPQEAVAQQTVAPEDDVETQLPAGEQRALLEGERWFNLMQKALTEFNFNASLVHVQDQRIEMFRWLHGHNSENEELELLHSLNGPEIHIIRRGQTVSYFHSMSSPFSVRANNMFGPIPTAFFREFENISKAYDAVPMGGARIMDRTTVHVRLLPKDQDRYGYSLWLDRETGMLLRMLTLSQEGEPLEQVQLTALEITNEPNPELAQILDLNLPPVVEDIHRGVSVQHEWQTNYLPRGFTLVRGNHHRLPITGIAADYFLYSDGLTRISLYVSEDPEAAVNLRHSGLESLYSHSYADYSVTVVGRLPMATLQRIATSVRR